MCIRDSHFPLEIDEIARLQAAWLCANGTMPAKASADSCCAFITSKPVSYTHLDVYKRQQALRTLLYLFERDEAVKLLRAG